MVTGQNPVPAELAALAAAHGVATSYDDWAGRPVAVSADTVAAVLAALDVPAGTPAQVRRTLAELRAQRAARLLPPTVVAWAGHPRPLTRPDGRPLSGGAGSVELADGTLRPLPESGGGLVLPADLPIGWHRLSVTASGQAATAALVVAPPRIPLPPGLRRAWGWMVQLYALRGAGSWGMGDYADLAELVDWSGREGGAGFVLCNPLHAPTPVDPIEDSPYFPSSRRFHSPLYLRVAETAEYGRAGADVRAAVDRLAPPAGPLIDRTETWLAKRAALRLLFPYRSAGELAAFRAGRGAALEDFALFCALAERHGRDWRRWPAALRHPASAAMRSARDERTAAVEFHAWLQLLCDRQLAAVAAAADRAGMPVGVVHDLAVGVDPGGADAWAWQDVVSGQATVGAPPDSFNQRGQDWQLPPWRPDRLAEAGYAPFREVLRAVLRHAGGIRVDHVMGLFRLWWVPAGRGPEAGAYVHYDAEAMLATVAVEAHAAAAVVVGEDLGTVDPAVGRRLADLGVLGSDVAWFCRDPDSGEFLPPADWRALAMASVSTHDLPTVAGWLADEPVRVRAELGQLALPVGQERARMAAERDGLLALLRRLGLLAAEADDPAAVSVALHALLAASPARLVAASPGDAVGDLRQPNLPGTRTEYPNWRLPLADATGRPVTLEEFRHHPQVARLLAALAAVR